MTNTFITVRSDETITEFILSRPEKRNALTYEMVLEMAAAGSFQYASVA